MQHNISINIKEVIEHKLAQNELKELLMFITYECMNKDDRKDYVSKLLHDILETEQEFDRRQDVIEAINTTIKAIE